MYMTVPICKYNEIGQYCSSCVYEIKNNLIIIEVPNSIQYYNIVCINET